MKKTVKSIQNQSFNDFEVWIIDGGSTNETLEYLSKLEAPYFTKSEKDRGIYDAMNKGISLSKGEWLYFLGSGDLLFNEFVLTTIFDHSINEISSIIAGKIIYEGHTKPFIYSKNKMIKNPYWSLLMWIRNGLHHQGTFYKKELFLDKAYNLEYETLSDYFLNLQFYKQNEKCKKMNLIISKCNSDGISKSGNWNVYKEEINLKMSLSSLLFYPIFYSIAFSKFISRKIINGQ